MKLHHIWKPQLQAVVYHNIPHFAVLYQLYTTVRRFDLYHKYGTYVGPKKPGVHANGSEYIQQSSDFHAFVTIIITM